MSNGNATSQTEFYVAKGEQSVGPWTIDEIANRVAQKELTVMDFVYDEGRGDWIALMDCEAFKSHVGRAKPKAPPPPPKQAQVLTPVKKETEPQETQPKSERTLAAVTEQPWFVQKGANRFGPMSYLELVRALQEKNVYDFDFIWQEGMETWMRLAEHPDFRPDRIRELAAQAVKAGKNTGDEVFFRRQFPRIRFESEVIVHDERSVWMGQAFEAGAGGSGLVIENSGLNPGQVVRLHFAPCDGLPAFNALGEIVGKRYSREVRGTKSPVRYAVRFLKLDGSAEPQVREYFETKNAG